MLRRWYRRRLVLLLISVTVAGGLAGYLLTGYGFQAGDEDEGIWPPEAVAERPHEEVTEQEARILPQTRILERVRHTGCGHEIINVRSPSADEVGLKAEEFTGYHGQAVLLAFSTSEVEYLVTTAGNCPERFIAVEAGQVAVFCGRPGNGLLLHKTDIRVDWLPPGEVARLEQGIIVENEQELMRYLEGFSE